MCHTRDKNIWGQLVQSQGGGKYGGRQILVQSVFVRASSSFCIVLAAAPAKLDQIWGQIFFPTIHWVSPLEVEKKKEKEEEEVKVGEEEEDRDNVQLRRSQSSVSCFDFLFSNHHSAAKTLYSALVACVGPSCE